MDEEEVLREPIQDPKSYAKMKLNGIGDGIGDIRNIIISGNLLKRNTRGSKFWSSKVCEGGESREAYACRLNFDPPQFLFLINDHVT